MKICPACERQNPADALICDSCGERLPIDSGWDKTRIRAPESGGFAPGHSIAGRYEIIKEIGRGGIFAAAGLVISSWFRGSSLKPASTESKEQTQPKAAVESTLKSKTPLKAPQIECRLLTEYR